MGGIAGSAGIVSDCRSMVDIRTDGECTGGILGWQDSGEAQEEDEPLRGNYYLVTSRDYGGVDGISYDGAAQPEGLEAFFALEGVPMDFRWARLTFVREDGRESVRRVKAGQPLAARSIPAIPEKEGMTGSWPGVPEDGLQNVYFDASFRVEYTANPTTVASLECLEGKPVLLLEGSFPMDWTPELSWTEDAPELTKGHTLLESQCFTTPDGGTLRRGRLLIPQDQKAGRLEVHLRGARGTWRSVSAHTDGSYLVFPLEQGDDAVAVVLLPEWEFPWGYAAAGIPVLALAAWAILRKRKATRPGGSTEEPAAAESSENE